MKQISFVWYFAVGKLYVNNYVSPSNEGRHIVLF